MSDNHDLLYQLDEHSLVALTQEDGRVTYPVQGGGIEDAPCMWFALCDRPAVTNVRQEKTHGNTER